MNQDNSKPKKIYAKTLTTFYDKKEDRLRLVFNYEDYNQRVDLMMTRKYTISFLSNLDSFLVKNYQTNDNSQVDIAPKQPINQGKTKPTDIATVQLTHKPKAYLLDRVDGGFHQTNKTTTLYFKAEDLTVVIGGDLTSIQYILKSIENAIPKIEWGISKLI